MINNEVVFCQSYGMPLDKPEIIGTYSDGNLIHLKEMFKDDPNFNEQEALEGMKMFFLQLKR